MQLLYHTKDPGEISECSDEGTVKECPGAGCIWCDGTCSGGSGDDSVREGPDREKRASNASERVVRGGRN